VVDGVDRRAVDRQYLSSLLTDDPTYYTASTVPELVEIDPVRVLAR
jgi:hypothetical protein